MSSHKIDPYMITDYFTKGSKPAFWRDESATNS